MRNLTFSIMIGGVLAFFFAGVVFAAFSLFRPGWLRQVAGAKPTPISVQTLVAIVAAGGQVPNVTRPLCLCQLLPGRAAGRSK